MTVCAAVGSMSGSFEMILADLCKDGENSFCAEAVIFPFLFDRENEQENEQKHNEYYYIQDKLVYN